MLLEEQLHFDDHLVTYAVQESFDETNLTKNMTSTSQDKPTSSATRAVSTGRDSSPEDDFYTDYPAPTRLETALSIANLLDLVGFNHPHHNPSLFRLLLGSLRC